MGRPKGWASDLTGRPAMRSPGRPPVGRREHRQRFWAAIARGLGSEAAGVEAGVSPVVGVRWFREGGGMPSVTQAPLSGRYLSFAEREEIALLRAQGQGVREIARQLGRSPSTISRELRRNAATRGGRLDYRASTAQWHADLRARRPKPAKLAVNAGCAAMCRTASRGPSSGRTAAWWRVRRSGGSVVVMVVARTGGGARRGVLSRSRLGCGWTSPMISRCVSLTRRSISRSIVQGRGALRRELTACLRTGRALRVPRARAHSRGKGFITNEVMISQRPAEAGDRAVPGHWEGDLILGLGSSAIGTLVERSSRFTMLLYLPPMTGQGPRVHNGPALAGHGAGAVRDAIATAIVTLPEQLRRSLTWDQGAEMAQHAQLAYPDRAAGLLL